jgi:hypothetical protein
MVRRVSLESRHLSQDLRRKDSAVKTSGGEMPSWTILVIGCLLKINTSSPSDVSICIPGRPMTGQEFM